MVIKLFESKEVPLVVNAVVLIVDPVSNPDWNAWRPFRSTACVFGVSFVFLFSKVELLFVSSILSKLVIFSIFCSVFINSAASYLSTSCKVWFVVLPSSFDSFIFKSLKSKFGILSSNGLVEGYSAVSLFFTVVVVSVVWYVL